MATKFQNDVPIDEELAILDLLCSRWGDCTMRELNLHYAELGPYIEISHCHEHADPDVFRFSVAMRAVATLLRLGYVRGTAHWGWRDDELLQISDRGRRFFWDEIDRLGISEELAAERWYW